MALFKEVKSLQIIPSYLVQPFKAKSSPHVALSQVALLARLLRDLGLECSGLTADSVMKVSMPRASTASASGCCLQHGESGQGLPNE